MLRDTSETGQRLLMAVGPPGLRADSRVIRRLALDRCDCCRRASRGRVQSEHLCAGRSRTRRRPDRRRSHRIYVELNKDPEDADRDRAAAAKIERVLTAKGFAIVPESEAAASLFFKYEMEDLVQRKYFQPILGDSSGMKTVPAEGPFVHRLSVSVIRAETNPTTDPPSTDVLWVGGAVLNATSIRSPEVIDILIVALFDHFPEDTGRTLRVPIHFRDPRAEDLRSDSD